MGVHRARFMGKMVLVLAATVAAGGKPLEKYGRFSIAEEPSAPRISAMGSAGTALAGGGFECYNPASPAFAPAPFLTSEYGKVPGDQSRSLFATSWMFARWFAATSLRFHSTDWQMANEQGLGAMNSDQMMQATVSGGFIWRELASGHSVVFFHERIGDQSVRAFTYSPGFVYRLVPGRITLGASMLHYLRLDTMASPKRKTPFAWRDAAIGMPRYVRAGAAWSDTLRRAGIPFTVAADLVYSDVYSRVMAPVGVETWILPYLAARAGARINHPSDIVHFGVGLRWSTLTVDLDYGITKLREGADPEPKWLLGLTFSLPSAGYRTAAPGEQVPRQDTHEQPEGAAPAIVPPVPVAPATPAPEPVADSLRQHPHPDTAAGVMSDSVSLHPDATQERGVETPAGGGDSTIVGPRTPPSLPEPLDSIPAMLPPAEQDSVRAPE